MLLMICWIKILFMSLNSIKYMISANKVLIGGKYVK